MLFIASGFDLKSPGMDSEKTGVAQAERRMSLLAALKSNMEQTSLSQSKAAVRRMSMERQRRCTFELLSKVK
jgi:hypothetical protein